MNEWIPPRPTPEGAIQQFLRDYAHLPQGAAGLTGILAYAGEYFGADCAAAYRLEPQQGQLRCIRQWCRDATPRSGLPVFPVPQWNDWFPEEAVYLPSLSNTTDSSACLPVCPDASSLLAAPVMEGGQPVGLLTVENPTSGTEYLLLLEVMASVCRGALSCDTGAAMEVSDANPEDRIPILPSPSEKYASVYHTDEGSRLELAQQRKIENAIAAVETANAILQEEMAIAAALSRDFPDVLKLDLENDAALCIKQNGIMLTQDDHKPLLSYRRVWEYYTSHFVWEEDRAGLAAAVAASTVLRALENQDEYTYSYRAYHEDGKLHHFQVAFYRIYSQAAETHQIIVGFRNVDAIVEEERAHARIQEEQLRIIDALSREYHSLFKIDVQSETIALYRTDGIGMAPAMLQALMQEDSYQKIIQKYIALYVSPSDQARIREATRLEVLLQRVPEVGLYKLGYQRILEGVTAYYEMNVVKTVDSAGTVTFIMGLRDVDDEMQRNLKQAKEIEAQSEIIQGLSSEYYSVLLVDPKTDTVTTYRAEDEDGQSIAEHFRRHNHFWSRGLRSYAEEWISQGSREEFLNMLSPERLRQGGEDYSFTYEKQTGSTVIYLQARVSFVPGKDGGFVAVVGTRNIDDLIKKERQQETALQAACDAAEAASRAKTNFLSNMSHDIRTPMNGIIGMTAIAQTHIDDKDRVQDCLQKITQASKHLLSLINEVLDMSKIETGKVALSEEAFSLSDLIDNLLSMTSSQLEEHRHQFSVNLSGVTHEAVIGDSLRIQKIFTNLMGNAIKFTPDGGKISLSISEKPCAKSQIGCYEFVFEDNGIGMDADFLERIFDPFSRAPDSRVSRVQGTGLGMAISRNIVRMMGGDIKVESTLGVGSRFTVTMYLKLQEADGNSHASFVDLNVLVADDDPLSLESCCDMLTELGMQADGVSNGAAAVAQIQQRHQQSRDYFACILDWKMPDMDGISTARAIRNAVGPEVPIIILSAYDWSDIEQEARSAGVNAFIGKPLFRSKLEKTFDTLANSTAQPEPEAPLTQLNELNLSNRRVLLAEDNELNAEIAIEMLQMTGLSVEHAVDGKAAVDMISAHPEGYYDLIFMDIQMPNLNGYDATRAIRAIDRADCRNMPILAMTANAFAEDVLAAKTVGMNAHIAKPLDWNVLADALRKWLSPDPALPTQ